MIDSSGFVVERQSKKYGNYVSVQISDGVLSVEVRPNAAGLLVQRIAPAFDRVPATRQNADAIGFLLAQVIERIEDMGRDRVEEVSDDDIITVTPGAHW